ncbi:MAG: S46 family peptidase [Bacteroidaceae bacterium]
MKRLPFAVLLLFHVLIARADEGMWMLGNLNKPTLQLMQDLGLKLPADQLYSTAHPSLSDAIVSFGGFCSGVVVSNQGLVFTNHHCGFDAIQQHTSLEHDYLKDGFTAHSKAEELPNPELFVSFLVRTENVTEKVLSAVLPQMTENERKMAVDSVAMMLQDEVSASDSLLHGVVDAYYEGNEYYLSVYKDYNDVRLVFAPPSSIGKFGGDTDNWVWPRHTGDFSVFRIYANKDNQPASYSPDNVPYRPTYVAPISLKGYQEGSFCMTLGYPGQTNRYLSSFGIEERRDANNQAMIKVRTLKQSIWKEAMEREDSIRIKYASKYAVSANYWKNSIGMNKAITELKVIEQKQALEVRLKEWIQQNPDQRSKYVHVLTELELNYRNRRNMVRALAFFGEAFVNAPELVVQALSILNFDFNDEPVNVQRNAEKIKKTYTDINLSLDKTVFVAMLKEYQAEVETEYLPEIYSLIQKEYKGDYQKYADYLYQHSQLTTSAGFERMLRKDSTFVLFEDPAAVLALDLLVKYYDMQQTVEEANTNIEKNERLFNAAIREMQADHNFYPDANSTMRLSVGMIGDYSPRDGIIYDYYTTTRGIFEKVRQYKGDSDFEVQPALLKLLSQKNFGKYADSIGEMNVCFISNNDITGGNSGSGMFNDEGQLLGLAFDGNWESMSGDLTFHPKLQQCIGVDVRYMLYIIDKYGQATHLIDELNLK